MSIITITGWHEHFSGCIEIVRLRLQRKNFKKFFQQIVSILATWNFDREVEFYGK